MFRSGFALLLTVSLWLLSYGLSYACTGSCSTAGSIKYCSGTMKYCNGTTWTDLPAEGTISSCSTAGKIDYTSNKLRFCNGSTQLKYLILRIQPGHRRLVQRGGQDRL